MLFIWLYLPLNKHLNLETMEYTILETHLIFENQSLKSVVVLWEDFGDVRASLSDLEHTIGGYYRLKDYDIPTMTLFQSVAGGGRKLTDLEKKQYFPTHKIEGNE